MRINRIDGIELRKNKNDKDSTPKLLRDVFFSEDWGDGVVTIHNTKIDDDIEIIIKPLDYFYSEKVRYLINKFCSDLADVIEISSKDESDFIDGLKERATKNRV